MFFFSVFKDVAISTVTTAVRRPEVYHSLDNIIGTSIEFQSSFPFLVSRQHETRARNGVGCTHAGICALVHMPSVPVPLVHQPRYCAYGFINLAGWNLGRRRCDGGSCGGRWICDHRRISGKQRQLCCLEARR